jgi:hypothetical protein
MKATLAPVLLLSAYSVQPAHNGALPICPPINRPRDISTQTKRRVYPTNRLLWQFATMTFWFKSDGLYVHPKRWHSSLENFDGCHGAIFQLAVIICQNGCDISTLYSVQFGLPTAVRKSPLIPGTYDPKKYLDLQKEELQQQKNDTSPKNPLALPMLICVMLCLVMSTQRCWSEHIIFRKIICSYKREKIWF